MLRRTLLSLAILSAISLHTPVTSPADARTRQRPVARTAEARTRHQRLARKANTRPGHRRVVRKVRVTGYCMGPCRRCGTQGLTYTGTRTLRGIAVARRGRRAAPLGSRIFVPGYGSARVDDVGGGVGSTQIDLRFKSHRHAARWGSRRMQVVAILTRG
jgi:3D (Asp-Asp-Asp) domain-containing protein